MLNPIAIEPQLALPERDLKEMLTVRKLPDGRSEIRINNSSYSLLAACKRKAHYALERRLTSQNESPATLFGRAIHAGLEVWYSAERTSRRRGSSECDDSTALMECGQAPIPHGRCVRCSSQAAFIQVAQPLAGLDPSERRSLRHGTRILDSYFDHYADDPFVVVRDELGPISERMVEIVLAEESDSRVVFFGTIDVVLRDERTQNIVLCDHKTTSSLGSDFLNRINPSSQFRGYMAAFRKTYPQFDTRTFMVNGLLVAKTKQEFLRQFVEIDDGAVAEWREALLDQAYDWWARLQANGPYPLVASDPCTAWGGCTYRQICEVPSQLRESVILAQYGERPNA